MYSQNPAPNLEFSALDSSDFADLRDLGLIRGLRSQRLSCGFRQMVALLIAGEGAMLHVFAVVLDGIADEAGGIGIAADELGRWREGHVEQVVEDEDLAVAI